MRTNCRDFNPSDYRTFPVAASIAGEDFTGMASQLQQALDSSSSYVDLKHSLTGSIRVEQFRPRECKSVIDIVDRLLADHYALSDDESDFIINYDIKYRMGINGEGGEESEE